MVLIDYIAVSTAVTDRITLADGRPGGQHLGGAGIYALCGIRLWSDSVMLVAGVGEDFTQLHGDWFWENGLSTEGLVVKDPRSIVNEIEYHPDGERTERAELGEAHFARMCLTPAEVASFCSGIKGLYLFQSADQPYWREMFRIKEREGFRLMWELNAESARPEQGEAVRGIAEQVDVFSLNRTEAMALFGTENLEDCIGELCRWQTPMIYLRMGALGGMALAGGNRFPAPAVPGVTAVDPTGAGNSSSAAVLYGFCEGYAPPVCAWMGSISAAQCITQYGVPPRLDQSARDRAEKLRMARNGPGRWGMFSACNGQVEKGVEGL